MKASLGRSAIQLVMDVARTSANIVRLLYHKRERSVKGFTSQLYRSFEAALSVASFMSTHHPAVAHDMSQS